KSQEVDNLVGGNLEPGTLTELFGEVRIGKMFSLILKLVPIYIEEIQDAMQNGAKKLIGKFREENLNKIQRNVIQTLK
ncbi:hypothetical protein LCGC14_2473080, partial [marine sediment metagenome]